MTTFLEQYTPSPWQIDHVNLHVNLFQDHALIRSKLSLRQNEQSPVPGGKLRLNGENQQLIELLVDGIKLTPERFHLEDEVLTIAGLPAECELEIVTRSEPQNNRELSGLYRSGKHVLHTVRGGRLPAYHVLPGSTRCDGTLYDYDRGR